MYNFVDLSADTDDQYSQLLSQELMLISCCAILMTLIILVAKYKLAFFFCFKHDVFYIVLRTNKKTVFFSTSGNLTV